MVRKRKKEKRNRLNAKIRRRIMLAVTGTKLVLVLLFLLLFKVDNIIVSGNERYTDEEIKALCINENAYNNSVLYYLFHRRIDISDVPLLDYVDTVYIDRNTISLRAHEKLTIGMFRVGDKVCCIDQDGVVIEIVSFEESANLNLPLISGLGSKGTVGERIEGVEDSVLNALSALKSSFDKYGISPEYIYIERTSDKEASNIEEASGENLEENSDASEENAASEENSAEEGNTQENDSADSGNGALEETVTYSLRFGNIKVLLGEDKNLEEKMRRVAAIIPMISDRSGELHLENFDEDTENIVFDTNAVVE